MWLADVGADNDFFGNPIPTFGSTTKQVEGRDHFPFAVRDPNPAYDVTLYPLTVSSSKMCRWYWRVKSWKMTGSAVFSGVGKYSTQEVTFNWNQSLPYDYRTRESDLLPYADNEPQLGSAYSSSVALDDQLFSHFRFLSSVVVTVISWDEPTRPGAIYMGDFLVAPQLSVRFIFAGSYSEGDVTDQGASEDWDSQTNEDARTILIDGVNLNLGSDNGSDSDDFTLTLVSQNISIVPESFFPYKTTNDLPVFDSTTGKVLNDPES